MIFKAVPRLTYSNYWFSFPLDTAGSGSNKEIVPLDETSVF
jgi:hypothetical protein